MKKYMPLEGLRWSRDSGSTLCDTPQNGRSRTGWGGNGRAMNMNVHNQECHEELHDIKPRYDFLWLHEILDILILISFLLNKQ